MNKYCSRLHFQKMKTTVLFGGITLIGLILLILARAVWRDDGGNGNKDSNAVTTSTPPSTSHERRPYFSFESAAALTEAVDVYLANDGRLLNLLQRYGPLPDWNVSQVESFSSLFNSNRNPWAASFNANVSAWDVANAKWMDQMFQDATLFDADLTMWQVGKVRKFNSMFEGAYSFQGKGLEQWDVSSGKFFTNMFANTQGLSPDLDLRSWNVSEAVNTKAMFWGSSFGATDPHNNLCHWRSQLSSLAAVEAHAMFLYSACPQFDIVEPSLDPNVDGSFCVPCKADEEEAMNTATLTPTSVPTPTLLIPTPVETPTAIITISTGAPTTGTVAPTIPVSFVTDFPTSSITTTTSTVTESPTPVDTFTSTITTAVDDSASPTIDPLESSTTMTTASPTPAPSQQQQEQQQQQDPVEDGDDSSSSNTNNNNSPKRPNILFLMTDQQRFDALRFVQEELWYYNNVTKIQTPNLDRLAQQGAYFRNAYCQSSVCAPARTTLRTGCTVERTGIQHNDLISEYMNSPFFTQRVESLKGLDELLKQHGGYRSEYYGKWHMPDILWADSVDYNDFDYNQDAFTFTWDSIGRKTRRFLAYHEQQGNINQDLEPGMQQDTYSGAPYTPIPLDPRHQSPTGTDLTTSNGFQEWQTSEPNVLGPNKHDANYTNSWFIADMAGRALERLVTNADETPFFLTVSFHNPHPPMVPAVQHWAPYRHEQDRLFVSHNLYDDMSNADYSQIASVEPKYQDRDHIQEWTGLYYALITEIDELIGNLLSKLGDQADNTLIIFTSDHGEMLGAHGTREKNNFYEEAARVPLFLTFPGVIPPNTQVDDLVSHLDVVATLLDYAGLSDVDESDGTSLRSVLEGQRYNADHDESIVVAEWDYRKPLTSNEAVLERRLDERPALMIRKDNWKLMIHKDAMSHESDMMFDLNADPFEMHNVLGTNAPTATVETLQVAEHLRCLLLEWMQRMDGEEGYYSRPIANYGEGRGDIEELRLRQSWPALELWTSHSNGLLMGAPVWKDGQHMRNEYLYLGTRTSGSIEIGTPYLSGMDAAMFRLSLLANPFDGDTMDVTSMQCIRIQVAFQSTVLPSTSFDLDAAIHIPYGGTTRIIPLGFAPESLVRS